MNHIIYPPTLDGIASAYSIWKHLGDTAKYHDSLVEISDIPDDSNVMSFGFFSQGLLELVKRGCTVAIYDHHEDAMVQAMLWVAAQTETDGKNYSLRPSLLPPPPWKRFESMTVEQIEDWLDANPEFCGFTYDSNDYHLKLKFDISKSGGRLASEFCQGDHFKSSDFILYLEDSDLLRFKLPGSKAVKAALDMLFEEFRFQRKQSHCFQIATELHNLECAEFEPMFVGFEPGNLQQTLPKPLQGTCEFLRDGWVDPHTEAIAEFLFLNSFVELPRYAEDMAERGQPLVDARNLAVCDMADQDWFGDVIGFPVLITLAPEYHSEVLELLLDRYPAAPFAMTYRRGGDGVIELNLRSRNGFRCNRVAKKLGGGGDKSDAHFTLQQVEKMKVGDRFCLVNWEGFLHHGQNLAIDYYPVFQVLPSPNPVFKVLPGRQIWEEGGGAMPNLNDKWAVKMTETISQQVLRQALQDFKQSELAYKTDQTDRAYDLYVDAAQELYQRISGEVNAGGTVIVKGAGRQQQVRTMGIGYNLDCFQFSSNPNDKSAIEMVCMTAIESIEVAND